MLQQNDQNNGAAVSTVPIGKRRDKTLSYRSSNMQQRDTELPQNEHTPILQTAAEEFLECNHLISATQKSATQKKYRTAFETFRASS